MTRKIRHHLDPDPEAQTDLAPKHLTKQEFGQRVYRLMLNKGWNQSELARRAGLPRDSISTYVNGKSVPTTQSLAKLAAALGLTAEQLLPNYVEGAIREDEPSLDIRVSPSRPSQAWLRVSRLVQLTTAVKIAELLEADTAGDAADRD